MNKLTVKKREIDYKDYIRRSAETKDFNKLITDDVILEEDGKIKLIYQKLSLDSKYLVDQLKGIKYQTTERTAGLKTISRIFGYAPRVAMRNDYCHATSLAMDNPKAHQIICNYAKEVEDIYKKHDPMTYELHRMETDLRVNRDWKIHDTVFTSGIVNKDNPLKYHFDAGNFKYVYSCMLGFKFNVEGGYLSLPEYDLGLEIADNSILIFDGQGILHGVTPFTKISPDAYRYTIVYYSLKQMWKCKTIDEEVARIRNVKTKREYKRK